MDWSLEDSKLIYGVNRNDLDYLDINTNGLLELIIGNNRITLQGIAKQVGKKTKYKNASFAIRVPQLITKQIKELIQSFEDARKSYNYSGNYQPIYPIKVNSQKLIIETIIHSHQNYAFEAGTKSEFILLMQALENEKHRLIMCNGAKDPEYLKSINDAIKIGHRVCISIETVMELKDTLKIITEKNFQIALRIKPYVTMHGHWGESSGRHSKFGLSIAELLEVVDIIKRKKKNELVKMLHAHPGSQITTLEDFYKFAEFMARTFRKLHTLGLASLNTINFGGGLPIDYDNSLDPKFMQKYAGILVECMAKYLPEYQPNICSESGRAITASSTMIMVRVIDKYHIFPYIKPDENLIAKFQEKYEQLREIDTIDGIMKNWLKWDRSAGEIKDPDLLHAFEWLSYELKKEFREKFFKQPNFYDFLEDKRIRSLLLSEYSLQGNFSVFNSIADYVLVQQYFPTIPISHLNTQPETLAHLYDITCDSDGKVACYHTQLSDRLLFTKDGFLLTNSKQMILHGFPIGSLDSIVNNYLLIPLAGAYQDIIEFDHNLLGDLPDILVVFDGTTWNVELINGAQSIDQLLAEVGFHCTINDDPYMDHEINFDEDE
ncbi:MAG: hypothetical protein ACFFDW_09880 [Candidatus Thorarchaeota archaeon]